MKLIKNIFSIILVLLILWNINVFSNEEEQKENIIACSGKDGFELYKCELENICLKEEYWANQNKTKIVNLEKNFNEMPDFEEASLIYKNNQNNIYKCWILDSQEKAFNELVLKLINVTDKTGILKTKVISKINAKLQIIESLKLQNKCNTIESDENNKKIIKKILLDQSTLEFCSYNYYLKFLDNREENDLKRSFPEWADSISAKEMSNIISINKSKIQKEMEHSMKMYPIAFETYTQYDSFIKIHIILELLKEDYRVFRDKLYQTLHPVNQLVYKIINAQSK